MPTIKHVGTHVDDLHDGRPIEPYATVEITKDELALDHYQHRLADGSLLIVPDEHLPTTEVLQDDGLDALTVADLRERADTLGVDIEKGAKKDDIVTALRQHATTTQETDHDAA